MLILYIWSDIPHHRYRGYRDQSGVHTTFFWRLLAIRLGFVIAFEVKLFELVRNETWRSCHFISLELINIVCNIFNYLWMVTARCVWHLSAHWHFSAWCASITWNQNQAREISCQASTCWFWHNYEGSNNWLNNAKFQDYLFYILF